VLKLKIFGVLIYDWYQLRNLELFNESCIKYSNLKRRVVLIQSDFYLETGERGNLATVIVHCSFQHHPHSRDGREGSIG
jgi:hypothetical protein